MGFNIDRLATTVQRNCHIADAKHGADYTLCIYLMKMREYYRWEQGMGFKERLSMDDVGEWLVEREGLWNEIDEDDFETLTVNGSDIDPFDDNGANGHLLSEKMVYGGGLGRSGRPHFFLAELLKHEQVEDYSLLVSGRELARDLTSPPAMSRDKTIYIRRESLKRMVWERLENWRWSSPDNAMGRALACYDFDNKLEDSLEQMTDTETEAVLWHEIGEVRAGVLLGDEWQQMLHDLLFTPAEIMARAVRDHLADSLVTLPNLLEQNRTSSIHFYFGSLSHMRKEIFPSLKDAYETWRNNSGLDHFYELAEQGREHWLQLGREILEIHNQEGEVSAKPIAEYVKTRYL